MKTKKEILDTLVSIAVDLTAAISSEDRYQRLLIALNKIIPYDAAALLSVEENILIPVASRGLSLDAMGRRYLSAEHPRLNAICQSSEPIRFPPDSSLPDPFDGLLVNGKDTITQIHSCMGCPLMVDNQLIGVLTADAFDPNAFDHLEQQFLNAIAALAGSQLQTANLINALELSAKRQGEIASNLMRDIQKRRGSEIIGNSEVMQHLKREIELVARSDFTVLVLGETGVGKELVVGAIHESSARRQGPMLYLNCAALPDTLAESELFGHTKGAFTGANADRAGKFEVADGGTLFLDEIGELPLSIQAKILRTIQEGEIQRIGSEKIERVDVRLLAATNRNLENEVALGKFRADLYHRLNVYPIRVPALRERKEDIQLLAGYFCEETQRRLGTGPVRLADESLDKLTSYSWPGNVRELENTISRAVLKAYSDVEPGGQILVGLIHLGADLSQQTSQKDPVKDIHSVIVSDADPLPLRILTTRFQEEVIKQALKKNKNNWAATARTLGMHRSNLHNLAKRLNLLDK